MLCLFFFFSSRRRHTRLQGDWSSDVCSSDLRRIVSGLGAVAAAWERAKAGRGQVVLVEGEPGEGKTRVLEELAGRARLDDATVAAARAVPADREREWSAVAGLLAGGLTDAPGLASAAAPAPPDRESTRLNSSHLVNSYAGFCL